MLIKNNSYSRRRGGRLSRFLLKTRKPTRTQTGVALLEAIIALTLLAAGGLALFDWISANLQRASSLQQRAQAQPLQALALAWADTLNPATQPEGRQEIAPGVTVQWHSQQTSPRQMAAPLPGGISTPFELALFTLDVTVQAPPQPPLHWQLQRLGVWRQPWESLAEDGS